MKICLVLIISVLGFGKILWQILKSKINVTSFFLCFPAKVHAWDYTITGPVESIGWGSTNEYPCYIAMGAETDGQPTQNRRYFYHKVHSVEMCKFAERCRLLKQDIIAYANTKSDSNEIFSIEYAHTKAKWW